MMGWGLGWDGASFKFKIKNHNSKLYSKVLKTISAHIKSTGFILKSFKKYASRDTIPLKLKITIVNYIQKF
jgi:hypothetical protein